MQILHGEHLTQSRAHLGTLIDTARAKNTEVIRIVAKKTSVAELEEALVSTSLFGTEKIIIIEELHSLPKSKRKDELISLVAQKSTASELGEEIILWESRQLTATMLKKFSGATVREFKLSKKLFSWLDSLGGTNAVQKLTLLHGAVSSESEHFCFIMLMRQVRLLIQAKDGGTIKGAPFMVSKLRSQAKKFSLEKLLQTHGKLLEVDRQLKSSGSALTLAQQLDLLTLSL
jgi:DNA polymerase III delta subunit